MNTCEFQLEVRGNQYTLRTFGECLIASDPDRTDRPDKQDDYDGYWQPRDFVLEWVHNPNRPTLAQGDTTTIDTFKYQGQSDSAPPLEFFVKLSQDEEDLPGITFLLSATTEHELYQEFTIAKGQAKMTYEESINIQLGGTFRPYPPGKTRMTPD